MWPTGHAIVPYPSSIMPRLLDRQLIVVLVDMGCCIPPRGVDMSIDMLKFTTRVHQNDVAVPSAVDILCS